MKRSEALSLIANQLDFLNGTFEGVRKDHTEDELKKADVTEAQAALNWWKNGE